MTGGQVAALGCGVLLLLPGGCFVLLGTADGHPDADAIGIGVFILLIAVALFFFAFSRQRPPQPPFAGGPPP